MHSPHINNRPTRRVDGDRWIKVAIVCGIAIGAVALRFSLLKDQMLFVSDLRYDSRLFIELARFIVAGEWLGPYNERTLIKGPFYPLWIAAVHALHLPLLKAQHALYATACATAAYALGKSLGAFGALIFFAALLFSPASYAAHTGMVLREYVSQSLAVLVVSLTALMLENGAPYRRRVLWASLLGTVLGCFWLTREESVWIVPFYATVSLHFVFRHMGGRAHRKRTFVRNLSLMLTPLVLMGALVGVISAINKSSYGIWETVELKSRFFRDAYGALTRVHPASYTPVVPVPREVRMKLYEVSPAFRELRPILEQENSPWSCAWRHLKDQYTAGTLNKPAQKGIEFILEHDVSGVWRSAWDKADQEPCDLYGPWFVWALREAAAAVGHHVSAAAAQGFYERLADEINAACTTQILPCGPPRSSLAPPWRSEFLRPFLMMFGQTVRLAVSSQGFELEPPYAPGGPECVTLFRSVTREEPMQPLPQAPENGRQTGSRPLFMPMGAFYRSVFPWVFYTSVAVLAGVTTLFFRRVHLQASWGFAVAVLSSFAALGALLAYVHVTSFPGIEPRYLAVLHPISLIAVGWILACLKELIAPLRHNGLDPQTPAC